jgi:tetratricopeptide (TPR) repeat protein
VRARHWIASLLLLAAAAPLPLRADEIASLRAAVDRHPEDRDLSWALARSLADAEREEEALAVLEGLVARWPDDAAAQLRLGTLLEGQGRHREARAHLVRAVSLDGGSGPARMMLGVALGRLGRSEEADRQLVLAAELEPRLRSESLLLRGIARIERGELEVGRQLLEEAIELDPLSDIADAARLLLASEPEDRNPRLRIQAYAGIDYDSNVTLDNGSTPGVSSDRDDGAGVWGTLISGDVWVGEEHTLTVGARYHERDDFTLDAYDERSVVGFLTGQRRFGRYALRASGVGSYLMLGDEPYLTQAKLEPDLLIQVGERLGVLQIAPNVEGHFYEDDPTFPSLERDAISFGVALRQFAPIPGYEGARGSWGFLYDRFITASERDALDFEGDYDRNAYGGRVEVDVPLFWRVEAELSLGVTGEIYDHDNLIDYLSQLAADGVAHARRRRDVLLESGIGLTRPIFEHVDLELRWRFQDRVSNTQVYDYDRHVVGALIRVRSF